MVIVILDAPTAFRNRHQSRYGSRYHGAGYRLSLQVIFNPTIFLKKKKKIKILTGIETCLVSWVAGGGALPAFIPQLTGKEGEKPRFALILFILYL